MLPEVAAHKPCGSCGNSFSPDDLAVFGEFSVCAECQPAFVQSLRQGMIPGSLPTEVRYAGFWIRTAAQLVDTAIVTVFRFTGGFLLSLAIAALVAGRSRGALMAPSVALFVLVMALVSPISYYWFFWTRFGATPGKMIFGFKVVDAEDHGFIRNGQAVSRWFSQLLSGFLLGYGFMKAGWSPEKRSLHDGIASTRVIYSR